MRLAYPVIRHLITLSLLGIAACATPPEPPSPPEPPLPPLAQAAVAEWEAWGRVTVDGWPDIWPGDRAATPERFDRLISYWSAVPGGVGVVRRLAALRHAVTSGMAIPPENAASAAEDAEDAEESAATPVLAAMPEDMSLYGFPAWSAAFISAIARRAGLPEWDLPSNARHARYIDAVLERAATDPEGATFLPFAPEERAPAPGDLLCADRAFSPLAHWSLRLGERGRPRPMHCDVVVRAGPGLIEAIGGNVLDLVTRRRLPADDTGRVLPAPPGRPVFVLVLAARVRPG